MFTSIGLSEKLVQALYVLGFGTPTPIQQQVMPLVMQGRDVIGCSPTGTGKTAAFVVPILHNLVNEMGPRRKNDSPLVVILSPTRELAQQIKSAIIDYATYIDVRVVALFGGVGLSSQIRELRAGVDIVIATPGRLLDLIARKDIALNAISVLVIDEIDRMYAMDFFSDIQRIISHLPKNRQTLLFSATMPASVRERIKGIQRKPVFVEIAGEIKEIPDVEQIVYRVRSELKMALLLQLLKKNIDKSAIIFSQTKKNADSIAKGLFRAGVIAAVVHADRTQEQRRIALDNFKRRKTRVLVATDLAARGLDIENVSYVISFDTPHTADEYTHRIGRTGRANNSGIAFTFTDEHEEIYLKKIIEQHSEHITIKTYEKRVAPQVENSESFHRKFTQNKR